VEKSKKLKLNDDIFDFDGQSSPTHYNELEERKSERKPSKQPEIVIDKTESLVELERKDKLKR